MRQDNKKNNKPAAALILCFCLMAMISLFMVKSSIDKVQNSLKTADVVKEKAVEEIEKAAPSVVDSLDNDDKPETRDQVTDFVMPVDGEVCMEYSMDMPIYWETLDQYMTHPGIDITAAKGSDVKSCADGTVTKITENDAMGITVEVNHGNGLISVYSNLASDGLIELGEVITKGTVIGKIGQSSLFEFEGPDHLHFEMIRNNEHVDPKIYLKQLS